MKSRFPHLTKLLKQLRSYVPSDYRKGLRPQKIEGSSNKLIFIDKIPAKITRQGQGSVDFVALIPKNRTEELVKAYDHASKKMRGERHDTQKTKQTDIKQEVIGVRSPFVQTLLYQGMHGKVIERASKDLYEYQKECSHKTTPISADDAKELIAQMILAVHALHQCNLVHRDIKPENFLVTIRDDSSVHIQLADLDSVCSADESILNTIFCTPDFTAPEICFDYQGETHKRKVFDSNKYNFADKKAIDCYALGLTIQIIAAGLFAENIPKIINDLINHLSLTNPHNRMTIDQAMQFKLFGNTPKECSDYFEKIKKKFEKPETYYDSYYQAPEDYYPEAGDAFLLLPKAYKDIYETAASLNDSIKVYEQLSEEHSKDYSVLRKILDVVLNHVAKLDALIETTKAEQDDNLRILRAALTATVRRISEKANNEIAKIDEEALNGALQHLSLKALRHFAENKHESNFSFFSEDSCTVLMSMIQALEEEKNYDPKAVAYLVMNYFKKNDLSKDEIRFRDILRNELSGMSELLAEERESKPLLGNTKR